MNSRDAWQLANPAIVVFLGLLVASVCLLLALLQKSFPSLLLIGGGMIAVSLGLLLVAFEPMRMNPWVYGVAFVLVAVGEVLAIPALVSRIGGDVHWRLVTLVLAFWLSLGSLSYAASGLTREWIMDPFWVPAGFAAIALPLGVILLGAAIPLQMFLFAPRKPKIAPAPPAGT